MAKMTKAQARNRLMEAKVKIMRVFLSSGLTSSAAWSIPMTVKDLETITKILDKNIARLK